MGHPGFKKEVDVKLSYNPLNHFPFLINFEIENFVNLLDRQQNWLNSDFQNLGEQIKGYSQEEIEDRFLDDIVEIRDIFPSLTNMSLFLSVFSFSELIMKQLCSWHRIGIGKKQFSERVGQKDIHDYIIKSNFQSRIPEFKKDLDILLMMRHASIHRFCNLTKEEYDSILKVNKHQVFKHIELSETPKKISLTYEFNNEYLAWVRNVLLELCEHLKNN